MTEQGNTERPESCQDSLLDPFYLRNSAQLSLGLANRLCDLSLVNRGPVFERQRDVFALEFETPSVLVGSK